MATTYKKLAPRTRKKRVTKSEVKLLYLKDASFLLKVHVTVEDVESSPACTRKSHYRLLVDNQMHERVSRSQKAYKRFRKISTPNLTRPQVNYNIFCLKTPCNIEEKKFFFQPTLSTTLASSLSIPFVVADSHLTVFLKTSSTFTGFSSSPLNRAPSFCVEPIRASVSVR